MSQSFVKFPSNFVQIVRCQRKSSLRTTKVHAELYLGNLQVLNFFVRFIHIQPDSQKEFTEHLKHAIAVELLLYNKLILGIYIHKPIKTA